MLSITSPCALPLIPSYLAYISSLPASEVSTAGARRVVLTASLLFVAGFGTVFVALGATASVLGAYLLRHLPLITRASGLVIIVMGLASLGLLRVPWLLRERRLDLARVARGPRGAFPLGMAFGFGWTPCIGPILATVLTLAASSGSVAVGSGLLILYSVGLALPFLAMGVGYDRLTGAVGWLRRHGQAVERVAGALLVAVGVGYLTGTWQQLFLPAQRWFAQLGWPPI